MARLLDSIGQCRTVYFCGLVKNAGKTIALRQTMREARRLGLRVGVTSVGRDGEAYDAIYSDFAKPLLDFEAGDIVVTSEGMLPGAGKAVIVHRFSIPSPTGELVAARIAGSCTVEVAGPSTIAALREVRQWLAADEVDMFLIDGALDRKAASVPDMCDGIVLSSGAAISDDMEAVLSQTRSAIDMLQVGSYEAESECRIRFSPIFDSEAELAAQIAAVGERTVDVEIGGAVTDRLIRSLMREGLLARCHFVADCFSKVFISRERWADYRRHGLRLSYRRRTQVLSLTVNPVSPSGPGFEAKPFLEQMRRRIPEIPVYDLCLDTYGMEAMQ